MDWRNYISLDPKVMCGKPVIKGTRITVELILERMGDGWTAQQLLKSYPHINEDQIRAALAYAAVAIRADDFLFPNEQPA